MTSQGRRQFRRAEQTFSRSKKDQPQYFSGLLGVIINGEEVVEVPTREGFVWVRLRNANNELIQAFNPTTSQVYDLPVQVEWDEGNPVRYTIVGRDIGRYQTWGTTSPYLAQHGLQHSFGVGTDITWVYGEQFMPLNAVPSGTVSGGPNVYVHPYTYFYNNAWHYGGGTGTASFLPYKPTGTTSARLVLVFLDADTNDLGLLGGAEFAATISGTSALVPFIPVPTGTVSNWFPIAAVRLVTGTSFIGWNDIYDLKAHYAPL